MNDESMIKVWDVSVRLFHWSLVLLFFLAYFTGEDDSMVHIYAGYGVIGLLAYRIIWGFIGSKYARFSEFVYGPAATLGYMKSMRSEQPQRYLGHNPLGGWMIILLLISLIGISWSGLKLYAADGHGPLAADESTGVLIKQALAHEDDDKDEHASAKKRSGENKGGDEEFWEELHELTSNLTLILIFLHLAGVVMASIKQRESLVKSMVTGYKKRS